MSSKSCVYAIVSPSGNAYIGSTIRYNLRKNRHSCELRRGYHHCDGLTRAAAKYGADNMTFEVLEECVPENVMEREQWWIDNHKIRFNRIYNSSLIANRPEHNAEARRKISEARRRYKITPEQRKNMSETHRSKGAKRNSKTGVKGVSKCSRSEKYIAAIHANNKQNVLGRYETIEDAYMARMLGELFYWNEKEAAKND